MNIRRLKDNETITCYALIRSCWWSFEQPIVIMIESKFKEIFSASAIESFLTHDHTKKLELSGTDIGVDEDGFVFQIIG